MQGPMAFLLGSHQLVADLRVERKFGMIERIKPMLQFLINTQILKIYFPKVVL